MNEIWPGSILSLAESTERGAVELIAPNLSVICFLIAVSVILLVMYQQAYTALTVSAQMLFSSNRAKEYLDDTFCVRSIVVTFFLSLPFLALTFVQSGLSARSYWAVLLFILLFLGYRHLALSVVRWLGGKREVIWNVEKFSCSAFLVMTLMMCLVLMTLPVIRQFGDLLLKIIFATMALITLLAYFIGSFKIIVRSGFSGFFWILYLCVFELLPLCVTVDIIVS